MNNRNIQTNWGTKFSLSLTLITTFALLLLSNSAVEAAKMYWTDWHAGKIHRANLDGTNVEDIITGLSGPQYIALDVSPPASSITVTPSPIAFGNVIVGEAK